ncbi:MAG: hypothetical protein M3O46_21730, partial [Myxococcota bacterium]|nr:hypothetical protein [Myxococcota bacterium]
MSRWAVSSLVVALALPPIATGRAAPIGGATTPSDPGLALAAIDRRVAEANALEQSDKQELARVGEQLALRHARVLSRGRAFYRMTRAGLLPVGAGFGALISHAMHVERARRVLISEIDAEAGLRGRGAELARDLESIAHDRSALASQRGSMDAARNA